MSFFNEYYNFCYNYKTKSFMLYQALSGTRHLVIPVSETCTDLR